MGWPLWFKIGRARCVTRYTGERPLPKTKYWRSESSVGTLRRESWRSMIRTNSPWARRGALTGRERGPAKLEHWLPHLKQTKACILQRWLPDGTLTRNDTRWHKKSRYHAWASTKFRLGLSQLGGTRVRVICLADDPLKCPSQSYACRMRNSLWTSFIWPEIKASPLLRCADCCALTIFGWCAFAPDWGKGIKTSHDVPTSATYTSTSMWPLRSIPLHRKIAVPKKVRDKPNWKESVHTLKQHVLMKYRARGMLV